jgi:hypothetical protein
MKATALPDNVYRHGFKFCGRLQRNGMRLQSPPLLSPEEAQEWLRSNESNEKKWREMPKASRDWKKMVADLLTLWADGRISATDHEATDLLDEFARKHALGVEK